MTPVVQDFESYAAVRGAGRQVFGEPALAKQPGASEKDRHRRAREQWDRDTELAARRDLLRAEYEEAVRCGVVRPPSRVERLIETAQGHDDNAAVQAARRILVGLHVKWEAA